MSSSSRPSTRCGISRTPDTKVVRRVEPQHRRRDLGAEPGGDQDDPDLGRDDRLVVVRVFEPVRERRAGIVGRRRIDPAEVAFEDLDQLVERHGVHHRGIAQRLELHVSAVVRSFELDDDETSRVVDAQEIDAPVAALEVAELLGHHQQ
ncbi:MAG: hypothetical protein GEV28_09835 [Actinophytocola sp.]|uniref:hypothetical protein n=1 Tax=Actinophytocola sp. TaxID=1872138 RepID=UPI001326895E|nr:hypothetical protein [Actinophytocola sp.]MPZ80666.1 hypothetical protein [Actinophytocola sp.]